MEVSGGAQEEGPTVYTYIGGVAGRATDGGRIENCVSKVYVTADRLSGGMGGVAGQADTVTGCLNYGPVSVTVNNTGDVGGIVGYCTGVSQCGQRGQRDHRGGDPL